MTSRRTTIAAGTAAIALILAGCGSGDDSGDDSATDTADDGGAGDESTDDDSTGVSGTLTIVSIPNYQDSLTAVVDDFSAANPDLDVQLQFVDVQSLHTTIRTQLNAGTAPDVFTAYPGNGTPTAMEVLVPGGYLMDLSDLDFNDRLPSGMDSVTTVDGKRYLLPLSLGAIGGIYNDQALAEVGVDAPATWTEVLEFCDAAQAAGKVAFAYGAQTPWNNQLHSFALSATLVHGTNPDFAAEHRAGEQTFSDSAWVEVLEKVLELRDNGCFQDAPLGTSYERAIELVAAGEAVSMVTVTSTFAALAAAASDETTFTFHALPATDNPGETWIPAGGTGGYAANADADNPEAARAFMEFLGSDEVMAKVAELQGTLPSIGSDQYDVPDSLTEIIPFVDEGRIHPYNDQLWPNARVATALTEQIELLIGDQASVQDVLSAMDAAYAEGSG